MSADIGEFGPVDGQPVEYNFPFYYHVQGILPWFLVVGLFALKENRNRQSLFVLVPFGIVWALYVFTKHLFRLPSSADVELNVMFLGLIGSFLVVLLLAGCVKNRGRGLLFLVPIGYIGFLYISGLITAETVDMLILLVPSMIGLAIAFVGARWVCYREFSISRFLLFQGLFLLVSLVVMLSLMGAIGCFIYDQSIVRGLLETAICGAICSVIYMIGLLPFEILLFNNNFWRKRFEAVFGIKTGLVSEPVEVAEF